MDPAGKAAQGRPLRCLRPGRHGSDRKARRREHLVRPAPPPPTADRPHAFGAGAPLWREELPEGDGRGDGDDLLIMSFDQLPSTLVHHPMVATTEGLLPKRCYEAQRIALQARGGVVTR